MNTQICIVTGQPLANLIPILHFKPKEVILVATNFMDQKAEQFKNLLQSFDFVENIIVLDKCPDTDLNNINAFLKDKLATQLPAQPCIFNLTGGTKLHSFSMYETFKQREFDDQFIYIDTQNRLLEYYPNKNKPFKNELLPLVLNTKMILTGMGKLFKKAKSEQKNWCDVIQKRQELTRFIAKNIGNQEIQQIIGSLNKIIGELYNGGKSDTTKPKNGKLYNIPRGQAKTLLQLAQEHNLIFWTEDTEKIKFNNYKKACYLSGIWLEEYVWLCAKEIGFDELYCSLEFRDKDDQAPNEIDLFIQHQNIALAIECKSATGIKKADSSQNMFHKLSGVASRAGGLMCHKLFVSAFELKSDSLLYAKDHNIKTVQVQEIIDKLPQLLQQWKEKGQL